MVPQNQDFGRGISSSTRERSSNSNSGRTNSAKPEYSASSWSIGTTLSPEPDSGTRIATSFLPRNSVSTQARSLVSSSTAGSTTGDTLDRGRLTMRALSPARAAARTNSAGVNWSSTSGKPEVRASGDIGRSKCFVRVTRQANRESR